MSSREEEVEAANSRRCLEASSVNSSIDAPFGGVRPKVLHLVNSFHQGGSERQALQLVGMLHRNSAYDVYLASLNPAGVLREQADALGVGEIRSYPLSSFYGRTFVARLMEFVGQLRRWKVSVVHTHDFYTNIFGMAAATLARVPARVASRRDLGEIRSATQGYVERRAYSLASRVIANSEAVHQQLLKEGVPDGKISVIHNGQDLNRVSISPGLECIDVMDSLNLPNGHNRAVVTMVANFRLAVKDHSTFLRAAQRIHKEIPSTLFVLAGEGELQISIRRLSNAMGLNDCVVFVDRCDHLGELLAASQVCVLSSRSEGFSNAILEYMAAARPVVATDVGGAREAIVEGETGYLVRPGDDHAMASRVVALLQDPKNAAAMGKRGRERVQRQFSCEGQCAETAKLYDQLLAKATSSDA